MGVLKILMGGSPCTYWSVAQSPDKRETTAEGLGWELFCNYTIAIEKYKPDYFLYENNKSMAPAIKEQISKAFGFEPVLINSALLSAQNRQRLYWLGKREKDGTYSKVDVEQPEDLGILLRDVLDGGYGVETNELEKSRPIQASYGKYATTDSFKQANPRTGVAVPVSRNLFVFENTDGEICTLTTIEKDNQETPVVLKGRSLLSEHPVGTTKNDKAYTVKAQYGENGATNFVKDGFHASGVAMPVRVGCLPSPDGTIKNGQGNRIYSIEGKAMNQIANGGGAGAKTGLYAVPVAGRMVGRKINEDGHRDDYNPEIETVQRFEGNENPEKTNCITTVTKDNMVAEPLSFQNCPDYSNCEYAIDCQYCDVCVKPLEKTSEPMGKMHRLGGLYGQHTRWGIWDQDGIVPTLTASMGLGGGHIPLIAEPTEDAQSNIARVCPIYEVKDGQITIKGKAYPIKLVDGFYIIRKLSVAECERLQTVPNGYCAYGAVAWSEESAKKHKTALSKGKAWLNKRTRQIVFSTAASNAYKALGNGWTVDVICHLLSHCDGITTEPLEVLSMYDGMSCGHIALDKLDAFVVRYYATEIDEKAMAVTMFNYPETIQLGDAFQVREEGWGVPPCGISIKTKEGGHTQ